MSEISLTASMRSNLLSLQNIASQQDIVQNRLATGLKVSSAIDNPSSYYTASSLNNRAADLTALLDAMSQGIQTIKAASEAIDSGTKFLEQAKAVVSQTLEINNNVSAVVSNETELLDAIASGKEGLIVIKGKITLSDNIELKLSDGQSLVGAEYAYGTAATSSELVFNTTDGTGRAAISSGSNSVISDLKISYTSNAAGADLKGAVTVENAENVKINNLDINFNASVSGKAASIYTDNSRNVILSGDIKILSQGTMNRAFQAVNNSQIFFENLAADFESQKANGICIEKSELNIGRNATVNVLTLTTSCDALYNVGGVINLNMNARVNLHTTGNNARGYWASGNSILNLTDTAKLNVRTEGSSAYAFCTNSNGIIKTRGTAQINVLTTGTNGEAFQSAINDFGGDSVINIEGRGENGDGILACKTTMRDNVTVNINNLGYSSNPLAYGSLDMFDNAVFNVKGAIYGTSGGLCHINMNSSNTVINASFPYIISSNVYFTAVAGARLNYTQGNYIFRENITTPVNSAPASLEKIGDYIAFTLPDIEEEMKDNQAPREKDNDGGTLGDISKNKAQFDEIIKQYDTLINDASYKGINLLSGQNLKINFNEDRSSKIDVAGVKADSQSLGISFSDWTNKATVEKSLSELENAISSLRSFASEFGNYYNLVTTRQDFTENLINVLEEGADKLTLADMNQESANMLALQTSQQLAVNSLSLASQSSQSILRLF